MLMIAQYVPWLAFAGAAGLLGWVMFDLLTARMRKVKLTPDETQDSGRGLVGKPVPLSQRLELSPGPDMPTNQVRDMVVEYEPAAPEEWQPDPAAEARASESTPNEPVSDTERCVGVSELAPESEQTLATESERTDAATSAVVYNDAVVQRDPSVRVYDLAVAPSERRPG